MESKAAKCNTLDKFPSESNAKREGLIGSNNLKKEDAFVASNIRNSKDDAQVSQPHKVCYIFQHL